MQSPQAHFVGHDPRIREVLEMTFQIADTDATVLIYGESGTGKEIVARTLHEHSSRRTAPFIAVNCGSLPESLQESELFGHARGAFTGAMLRKVGKFEAAHGGTVFLDEISEMSLSLQVNLLRVLQSGEFSPVGVAENRFCDVRVVAATNQNLQSLIAAGKFRQDLFYRLNIIRLELPPLRERKADIPLLVGHFLNVFGDLYHKPGLLITGEAQESLMLYDYPGNVRELENVIRRAVILCRGSQICLRELAPEVVSGGTEAPGPTLRAFHPSKALVVERFEREYLTTVLRECGGIVIRAARRAGLSERNFHAKLRRYGIHSKEYRAG